MVTVHKQIRPSLGFENDTTEAVRLAAKLARGRGARSNASGRYEALSRQLVDDGWESLEELPPFKTTVTLEHPKTILTRNSSPDISFDRLINPIAAASMAAAIATPGPPTPIWACPPASISRPSCSPS